MENFLSLISFVFVCTSEPVGWVMWHLVGWSDGRSGGRVWPRVDGLRRSSLHTLHQRLDRKTQGESFPLTYGNINIRSIHSLQLKSSGSLRF